MMWLSAVHIQQSPLADHVKEKTLTDVQRIVDALDAAERVHRGRSPSLPEAMREAVREAEALVLEANSPLEVPSLQNFIKGATAAEPDIGLFCAGYSTADSPASKQPAELVSKIAESYRNLRKELDDLETGDLRPVLEALKEYTAEFESKTNVRLEKSKDGIPTFGFTKTTAAQDIFRLAVLACIRCWTLCDFVVMCSTVDIVYGCGWWVAVVRMWIRRWAAHGGCDPLSGLLYNLSGQTNTPLRPTLLAHASEGRPMFDAGGEPSNATVQSWGTNLFLGSTRVSRILAVLRST